MANNSSEAYDAEVYESLYRHKPYAEEVARILPFVVGASVIDIGGGTGGHARVLKEKGFQVRVVDIGPSMVAAAKEKGLEAEVGDFDTYTSEKKFDTAVSLFHVINFSQDLAHTLKNIRALLRENGRFIFDYWNNTVKKEGWSFRWDGTLTRLVSKRWSGDVVTITFFFPFLAKKERHVLYCKDKAEVLAAAKEAGYTILEAKDSPLEYLFVLQK